MNFHDHDNLIRFLKNHEPYGPPPPVDHEERLLARLNQTEPSNLAAASQGKWWFPAMIAAGLVLVVGHGQLHQEFGALPEVMPQQYWGRSDQPQPKAIAEGADEELEAFLEESWSYSFGEHLYQEQELSYEYVDFVVDTYP